MRRTQILSLHLQQIKVSHFLCAPPMAWILRVSKTDLFLLRIVLFLQMLLALAVAPFILLYRSY